MNTMIAAFVKEAKCCARCLSRLFNHRSANLLRKLQETTSAENRDLITSMTIGNETKLHNCSQCLGLLEDSFIDSCIEEIIKRLEEEKYDCNTFAINAMVPYSMILRQHSLMLHARESFSDLEMLEDVVTAKDAFKSEISQKIDEKVAMTCDSKSLLRITVSVDYPNEDKELSLLPRVGNESKSRKRKNDGKPAQRSFADIQNSLSEIGAVDKMSKYFSCPPESSPYCCSIKDISFYHESVLVAGRYNKFSRELSQTPWFIDGIRKTESSVQELACEKIQEFFRADDSKFISAGREDVDVRMLGSGRPFAVELINPRRTKVGEEEMTKLQTSINESCDLVAVNQLQIVSKKDMNLLKEGEEHKIKFYSALVYAKNGVTDEQLQKLSEFKDLVVAQKTPIRVLHRRPLAVRNKTIHSMSTTRIDEMHFKLQLSTQAGTYIKEFVHGDFRRTKPSLGTLLGTEVDILELDVEEVQLEWPPKKQSDVSNNTQESKIS